MNETEYVEELKNLLIKSLKELIGDKKGLAIALSGGVDSTILAKLLKDLGINVKAYVIGIENCSDFDSAEKTAKELNLKLKKIKLSEKEIEENLCIQAKILNKLYKKNKDKIKPETPEAKLNPVSVSSNFPLFFVEKYTKEKYIISGLGADTILGGFFKYLDLNKEDAEKQIKKETKALLKFDYLEDVETAKYFDKEILMPFLDKDVAEFCLKLPYELKIKKKERKYILRKLAKEIGLSEEAAYRRKKSAQYGTGIMKIMKKIAKKKNMGIREYIKNCVK